MNIIQPPPLAAPYASSLPDHRERFILLASSAICFLVACCLPALRFHDVNGMEENWRGGTVLLLGWMGALVGQFAWFANLFLFGSWASIGFRWRPGGMIFAVLALLIASHSFALFGQSVPADEGGVNKLLLVRLLPGFYFWVLSIALSALGGVLCRGRT